MSHTNPLYHRHLSMQFPYLKSVTTNHTQPSSLLFNTFLTTTRQTLTLMLLVNALFGYGIRLNFLIIVYLIYDSSEIYKKKNI